MDSDNIVIILAILVISFFAIMYFPISNFVSDIQHEIDSGMYTKQTVEKLVFMQGCAVGVYMFTMIVVFYICLLLFK